MRKPPLPRARYASRSRDALPIKPSKAKEHNEPKFRLTMQIVLAARRWRALEDEWLRPLGHSAPKMEALSSIGLAPRLSAQVAIARRIGVEGPTLTRMLDMLQAEALVERLPDPSDRRAKLIRLTPDGEEVLATASRIAARLREQLLAGFTDEELAQMNGFVERLLARFNEDFADPQAD